jgi:hypothetical protein
MVVRIADGPRKGFTVASGGRRNDGYYGRAERQKSYQRKHGNGVVPRLAPPKHYGEGSNKRGNHLREQGGAMVCQHV